MDKKWVNKQIKTCFEKWFSCGKDIESGVVVLVALGSGNNPRTGRVLLVVNFQSRECRILVLVSVQL